MVKRQLKNIFLSASIPIKGRHEKYYRTADIIAIRDAVIALSSVVLPKYRLIWGGHPSITPIISYILEKFEIEIQSHVRLYQSQYFEDKFPKENKGFEDIIVTDNLGEQQSSIQLMRERMFEDNTFEAGVFIGGMDGVEVEFKLFKELNPKAILLPIASTGAAAKIIYDNNRGLFNNTRLNDDYAYASLFQDILINKI